VDYDKRNRLPPLRASPYIRDPPPPACAVRHSRGVGPPYKGKKAKKKKTKRRWWLVSFLQDRPSHLGLDSRIPILLGFLPSHASTLAAANVALGQWSRAWDLVILAFPSQNQQLSSLLFLILLRYTADRQWPVLICAAVRAMEFLARSMQDFFAGGGGISSLPWWRGSSSHLFLLFRNFSDICSFM
jgi:hypothetical protein